MKNNKTYQKKMKKIKKTTKKQGKKNLIISKLKYSVVCNQQQLVIKFRKNKQFLIYKRKTKEQNAFN